MGAACKGILDMKTGRVLLAAALYLIAGGAALAAPLGVADARHLLSRTGFAPSPREIAALSGASRNQAVERLLSDARHSAAGEPPPAVVDYTRPARLGMLSDDERKAYVRQAFLDALALRGWWVGEMLTTASPLTERMTLFWHNHFVSSQQKVKSAALMYRQNVLLRRHALGNFGTLTHAVAKDPAMLVYLDSATNRRGQPNENFAREVMELFTLGEGNYGEADIKEAARAFTGWSVDRETGTFRWRPAWHDSGVKAVLGRSGNFDGSAVLDILLAQPATAELIVAKLWREFVSPEPEAREVERIAAAFRASGYEIRVALRELLLAPAFWAPANRGTLVKSPVDLVVGTLRQFEVPVDDARPVALLTRQLGQDLFAPPNVKGWPGGEDWINGTTLLARKQFVTRLFDGVPMRTASAGMGMREDAQPQPRMQARQELGKEQGKDGGRMAPDERARLVQAIARLRIDTPAWLASLERQRLDVREVVLPGAQALEPDGSLAGASLVRQLALDPVYQLK